MRRPKREIWLIWNARTRSWTDGFAQTILHGALVANRGHIDEVDNDQAAEVAQTQLAGNFVSRFEVGIEGRPSTSPPRWRGREVDIDRGQRFGAIDNDKDPPKAGALALEGGLNLRFDLTMAEQRISPCTVLFCC